MTQSTFTVPIHLHSSLSIRESYLRFPLWTQPFWTLATGKPLPNERPFIHIHPALAMALDFSTAILSCGIHLLMLTSPEPSIRMIGYALSLVFALYLTGFLRKTQVVYGHHAIHRTLFRGRRELNERVAMCMSIFALSQSENEYKRDHLDHHRWSIFTTIRDADASLLHKFGVRPGKSIKELNRNLIRTLFSPRYHLWFLKARFSSNLRRSPVGLSLVIAWVLVIFVGIPYQFGFVAACLALWLPMTILYQMSALLQFTTEHVWLTDGVPGNKENAYAERCHGRFCGERVPGATGTSASTRDWLIWISRTLLIHFPMRLTVLVGDLPAHDWHHLVAMVGHSSKPWQLAIFERQHAIDSRNSAGMEEREIWGVDNMIKHVLLKMSCATPVADVLSTQRKVAQKNSF